MKVLVTGASGFIGRHLSRHLSDSGHHVTAVSRSAPSSPMASARTETGSITDLDAVRSWFSRSTPDVVIHLAAQSLPMVSWQEPARTMEVNVNGTMNVLTAIKEQAAACRFVMVSSSSVYAMSKDGSPILEENLLQGVSPYALSKIAAEQAALLYGRHFGLDVVVVRPFFIIGPGKEGDVCSDVARKIVNVEKGRGGEMTVGNTEITRDFLDIEDAVRAMELIMRKGMQGECYNICSGRGTTIKDILTLYKSMAKSTIEERVDPALIRPIDEMIKVGDPAKLSALGWSPQIALQVSLARILGYWREVL